MKTVGIGIIGGGLMGREAASAFARWCALEAMPVRPRLAGVCDLNPDVLSWFENLGTVDCLTDDMDTLLRHEGVEVVYVALPHNLHRDVYLRVLEAGKDLFGEKPYGLDHEAAVRIVSAVKSSGRFSRCSSEMPYFPGAQYGIRTIRENRLGRILEAEFGFHHSSDLDPGKGANWKRQASTCGSIGVMGDLGMHVVHIPFRLGWFPESVYGQLLHGYAERPDGKGGMARCDTWDNALLHTWVRGAEEDEASRFPMRLEMKRLAPGETNTWYFRVVGTEGGVAFSTKTPKTVHVFEREGKDQRWVRRDLGFETAFKTITGGIFEPGFPDVMQQMWAAFLTEREGALGSRFGCVGPEEALASHALFEAALDSHQSRNVETIHYD